MGVAAHACVLHNEKTASEQPAMLRQNDLIICQSPQDQTTMTNSIFERYLESCAGQQVCLAAAQMLDRMADPECASPGKSVCGFEPCERPISLF